MKWTTRFTNLFERLYNYLFEELVTKNIEYLQIKRTAVTEGFAVDLIITFLLAAILFPIAQNQLVSATTTNWSSAVVVMFEVLLPILVIVALVRHFA